MRETGVMGGIVAWVKRIMDNRQWARGTIGFE